MDKQVLLEWQIMMGADEAVTEQPINRYAEQGDVLTAPAQSAHTDHKLPEQPQRERMIPVNRVGGMVTMPPREAIIEANRLANAANDLKELRQSIEGFDGLAIKKTAANTVITGKHRGIR